MTTFDNTHTDPDSSELRLWAMVLHLSQFLGYAIPLAGFIAPVVIWQVMKDDLPGIEDHGRHAVNWMISSVIYGILLIPLCFVIIGIPLLIVLGILVVVFPMIAALKAYMGGTWRYPMSISFF